MPSPKIDYNEITEGRIFDDVMDGLRNLSKIQEYTKERLQNEWKETYNMPRKMKKSRRKEILLDWQIANCSLFEF